MYRQILEITPEAASGGRMGRAWLTRVGWHLAGRGVMASYVDALASGSYLAISHLHMPAADSPYRAIGEDSQARFIALMGTCHFRAREEIASLFAGTQLVDPGLAYLFDWWPDGPLLEPVADSHHLLLGGVGRKP